MREDNQAGSLYENKKITQATDSDDDDDDVMKPPAITASPSWPCANCQTTVSSERCPTCHGVQVRIEADHCNSNHNNNPKDSHVVRDTWLQRLSPAMFRQGTPTPTADYEFRPLDPVACILAAAPSPVFIDMKNTQLVTAALTEIEDGLRLRKRQARDLPSSPAVSPKKPKLLSAV